MRKQELEPSLTLTFYMLIVCCREKDPPPHTHTPMLRAYAVRKLKYNIYYILFVL